jgi:hypothetical protein
MGRDALTETKPNNYPFAVLNYIDAYADIPSDNVWLASKNEYRDEKRGIAANTSILFYMNDSMTT